MVSMPSSKYKIRLYEDFFAHMPLESTTLGSIVFSYIDDGIEGSDRREGVATCCEY